jgi:hypothetical protein
MMCYQISQSGEPVALVATIALAHRIVRCQPPGFYEVDVVEIGEPMSRRRPRARKFSIKHKIRRARSRAGKQPSPGLQGGAAPMFEEPRPQAR